MGGAAAAFLLFAGAFAPGAHAGVKSTKSQIQQEKARLGVLENQIAAERDQLDKQRALLQSLQGSLNDLAAQIDRVQTRYSEIEGQVMETRADLARTQARYERLRGRLDDRARYAYETGPAGDLAFFLSSESLTSLSDRVEFMNELSRNDADLANSVQNQSNTLVTKRQGLEGLLAQQAASLNEYQQVQTALDAKFAEQQHLYDQQQALVDDLNSKAAEVNSLLGKLQHKLKQEQVAAARAAAAAAGVLLINGKGPFQRCPVYGPHAYSDSFGAPRYAGGYHPHAGNDIMAPRGTPIVAPFPGNAYEDPNGLGGNAFILRGSQGYVYGAHLDSYGTMGNVSTGTVLGYVGDSGDAQGGPTHLHFEWHPNAIPSNPYRSVYGYTVIGSAVDPYPYLNLVC
ncbi:MAG: peptidoglycan DD-metalloendopeptidase family protein [Actinomycetota bacterium]|nr:peptidoglycan DD-metalloendopeptidase family protein [Actinomycetota bacterium]